MATSEFILTRYDPPKRHGKRICDIFLSSLFLFLGVPLFLILMILIKGTSHGPIFYKSMRMGQKGRMIYCWKFRTMIHHADRKLHAILKKNSDLRKEWETYHKLKKDPRLTKLGIFLRKTSLDELPQFWNVLKGDLSIVGPRPIDIHDQENAKEEIYSKYLHRTEKIISVRPGLTCLWQIKGRNHLTFAQRAHLEEEYIDNQSFWLDLKIICKTVYILLYPKGAF